MYVRVNGHLKMFQSNKQIFAFSVRYGTMIVFNLLQAFGISFEVKCFTHKVIILLGVLLHVEILGFTHQVS